LAPEFPFPAYSYVPGGFPHPTSDPRGHSYQIDAEPAEDLRTAPWRKSRAYLYGIDLFNFGYYWEAHEAWEAHWHAAHRVSPVADLLKGLIKLAAAAVKVREGNRAGVRRHLQRARELFEAAWTNRPPEEAFLGLKKDNLLRIAAELARQEPTMTGAHHDYRLGTVLAVAE
jgi:predicted metal-dependent hydrolase